MSDPTTYEQLRLGVRQLMRAFSGELLARAG